MLVVREYEAGGGDRSDDEDVCDTAGESGDLVADDLVMNIKERSVSVDGVRVNLTNAEFNMLKLLLENAGSVLTKGELTEAGVSRSLEKHDRSVDMHISNLRKKIGLTEDGCRRIDTVRGVGYIYNRKTGAESTAASD